MSKKMSFNRIRTLELLEYEASHGATPTRFMKIIRGLNISLLLTSLLMTISTLVVIVLYPAVKHDVIPQKTVVGLGATSFILLMTWLSISAFERKKKRDAEWHVRYYHEYPSPLPQQSLQPVNPGSHRPPSISPSETTPIGQAAGRVVALWDFPRIGTTSVNDGFPTGRKIGLHHQEPDRRAQIPPTNPGYRLNENLVYTTAGAETARTASVGAEVWNHAYSPSPHVPGETAPDCVELVNLFTNATAQPRIRETRGGDMVSN